jgi:methanogenic corrinoid protein MtbC1
VDGQQFSRIPDAQAQRAGRLAPGGGLETLVAHEVIPRLLVSCRAGAASRRPSAAHVETLARLALARDPVAAGAQVMALRDAGMSVDALMHDLIAPAAGRLGDMWNADTADFMTVALASARLMTIVRTLGTRAEHDVSVRAPRALIATPSGERHALGALIVAHALRRAGWRVREMPGADAAELSAAVAAESFALIGLSAASDRGLAGLARIVRGARDASANRGVMVAAGGRAFMDAPDRASEVDADFVAADGRELAARAQSRLSRAGKTGKSDERPPASP